ERRVLFVVRLRCEREASAVLGDDQRIDLDEARVAFAEKLDELAQEIAKLLLLLAVEAEPEAELARLVVLEARGGMERERQDLLGRLRSHLFDVHAARRRSHHGDPLGGADRKSTRLNSSHVKIS